ncbi:MAG: nucleotidyltransferase family protein [Elusimicrobiota bacterium]
MKAMILAAGLGRRLRPLTERTPKALIEIGEKTLLEIVVRRLAQAGADGFVINAFHLAGLLEDFLRKRGNFGFDIAISREETLLDTGGGIKKAAALLDDGNPFFIHNVDVISDIDFSRLYQFHTRNRCLATLAVQHRPSSRALAFDSNGNLRERAVPPESNPYPLDKEAAAFCGIHVASPSLFLKMRETGSFSIVDAYLRLAKEGERIRAFACDESYCQDVGTHAGLESARARTND